MKLRTRNNSKPVVVDKSDSELDENVNINPDTKSKQKSQTKSKTVKKEPVKQNSDSEFEINNNQLDLKEDDDIKSKTKKKIKPASNSKKKKDSNVNKSINKENECSGYFSTNDNNQASNNVKLENLDSDDDDEKDFLEPIKLKKQKSQTKTAESPQKKDIEEKNFSQEKKTNKKTKAKKISLNPSVDLNKTENLANNIENLLKMETQFNGPKSSKEEEFMDDDDDDESDEGEFEEVEMEKTAENELKLAQMSKETNIVVTIDPKKKTTKKADMAAKMERMFKCMQKQLNVTMIKTHLLCWLTHGFYLNSIALNDLVRSVVLSMDNFTIEKFKLSNFSEKILTEFLTKMKKKIIKNDNSENDFLEKNMLITPDSLIETISSQKCSNYLQYILIILIALRNLNIKVRLCVCFDVIPMNNYNKQRKPNSSLSKSKKPSNSATSRQASKRKSSDTKQKDTKKKKLSKEEQLSENSEDSDYEEEYNEESSDEKESKAKKSNKGTKAVVDTKNEKKQSIKLLKSNNKILSSDADDIIEETNDENYPRNANYRNYWLEIYLEKEKTWCSVDPFEMKINSPDIFETRFGKNILYVCAFDNDNKVKDVTKRYADEWLTTTRFMRVGHLDFKKLWWERTLMFHQPLDANLDIEEDKQLKRMLLDKGFPSSLSEFKDHPLYVLKKHLLKYQAIYPQEINPAGMFRNEPIYYRDNLVTLHSRQTWLKLARVVKPFETTYKVVKGRLKMSEYKAGMRDNPDLDLFGYWQTKEYDPPVAENGRVPRNEFGNVEMFQPHMLPIGCVHLKNMPNLNRVCRKLGIDCAAAVIGFDAHGGFSHAVYDGWVICEEFKDTVSSAYEEERRNEVKRALEKREAKILNNWAHLVKLLLIRERLKKKYDTKKSIMTKIATDQVDPKISCEIKQIPIESLDIVGAKLNKHKIEDESKMDIDDNEHDRCYEKIPINSNKNKKSKPKPKSKASSFKTRNFKQKNEPTDESDSQDSEYEVQEKAKKRPVRKAQAKVTRNRKRSKEESDKEQTKDNKITETVSKEKNTIEKKQNQSDDFKLSESESE